MTEVSSVEESPSDQPVLDTTPYGAGPDDSVASAAENAAVTHHVAVIGGKTIPYTARAGHLVTVNPSSAQPAAAFFYVSFAADGVDPSTRPVTFFYNGGPGSSSVFLLLGSFAPRRIKTNMPDFTPPAPYTIEDNPDSLLDRSDLVFINPVGTGYSSAIAPNRNRDFWGVDQDARSIAQFIKRYLTAFDRWNSPKFLFGESYGTPRTCVLAWMLHEDGVDINGLTLQSSILDYTQTGNPVGLLPTLAADAWYHNKVNVGVRPPLPAFMDTVKAFAQGPYAKALTDFPKFDAATLQTLSDYLGISPVVLTSWSLNVEANNGANLLFLTTLLQDRGLALGAYDGRVTAIDTGIAGQIDPNSGGNDPTMTAVSGVYTAMWNTYLNDELKFTALSPFADLNDQAFQNWDFGHIDPTGAQRGGKDANGNPVLYTAGDLAAVMALNPSLKVFSANGYYDSVTPFFQTALTLAAMPLTNPSARANLTVRNYPSGHMIYLDGESRTALKADLSVFYDSTRARFIAQALRSEQSAICRPYFKLRNPVEAQKTGRGQAVPASWGVPDLCKAYDWPQNLLGGGVIAIVELGGGWVASDMDAYFAALGQPVPQIVDVPVAGAGNNPNRNNGRSGDADVEVALDIQIAAASYYAATGRPASIRVYWASPQPSGIAAAVRAAAADGCDVCSLSWGADEALWVKAGQGTGQDLVAQMQGAAQAATTAGMVVFAAAGDNNSSDGGSTPANVDMPASCPNVIGCGGTSKSAAGEVVWNENPGNPDGNGTGGGFSTLFAPQPWEAGAPHGPGRMVPDVSAHADPRAGYEICVHGQTMVVGGTSAVAPLYAGLFAAFGRKLGFITPKLWLNHMCFNDITVGDNGYYRARIGPDPCTGIGSPIGSKLATLFDAPAAGMLHLEPSALPRIVPDGWSGSVYLTFVEGKLTGKPLMEPSPDKRVPQARTVRKRAPVK